MLDISRKAYYPKTTMTNGFALKSKFKKSKKTAKQTLREWTSFFESLEDPRGRQGREHNFLSIVMIAILATVAGAEGWDDIELYAESHQRWLEELLELRNGIPHADTYRRVFALINPEFGICGPRHKSVKRPLS